MKTSASFAILLKDASLHPSKYILDHPHPESNEKDMESNFALHNDYYDFDFNKIASGKSDKRNSDGYDFP